MTSQTWDGVSWRVELCIRKAVGRVPELSWSELWHMTRARGGFGLGGFVDRGLSLAGSVTNIYDTQEDLETGARIFREQCELCHGEDGIGRQGGPALNRPGLVHGDSAFAIYRGVRDGIHDTAMGPTDLSLVERWQVVGYVQALQLRAPDAFDNAEIVSSLNIRVTSEQIRLAGSRPNEWLTYSGSFDGRRYSPLAQINRDNVERLQVFWVQQFETNDPINEATPLVVDGMIFTTEPPANVVALEAKSGDVIWRYQRSVSADLPLCCGRVNRGLAVLDSSLFLGTLDGYLVAIDANTGQAIWETRVASPSDGYTMTGAPLIVDRSVVVGVAGGEFGIRGFLAAYDVDSGELLWKFNTIPGPGEPGHETWENDAWQTGGGPTWITGSYDPELDLIYWGVGNPGPPFAGYVRPGDNLFNNSVIALRGSSGQLAWHFQFTPHDVHDWDSNQTPILVDIALGGVPRKVICWANRNGFYYVLDRVTGEFLMATPFVEVTWATGIDSAGRPIEAEANENSAQGRLTRPAYWGGTNWQNPAMDQDQGLVFVPAVEAAGIFSESEDVRRGSGGLYAGSAGSTSPAIDPIVAVRALDIATGAKKWEHVLPSRTTYMDYSGLLATGGGLIFGASGGSVFALDSTTGAELWRLFLGGTTRAAPISFTVDGHQVVAVSVGRAFFLLGLSAERS
jgi:alcohol dehydrogenase (cytochrome c)